MARFLRIDLKTANLPSEKNIIKVSLRMTALQGGFVGSNGAMPMAHVMLAESTLPGTEKGHKDIHEKKTVYSRTESVDNYVTLTVTKNSEKQKYLFVGVSQLTPGQPYTRSTYLCKRYMDV